MSDPDADSDWAVLTSSGSPSTRRSGEGDLAFFLREVELANQRRRTLGLEFWRKYPRDPRRFRWLILATHLAPEYPVDVYNWAEQEATFSTVNGAEIDQQRLAKWVAIYPELRKEFWNSQGVKDNERRFLWFGEISEKFLRAIDAIERGDSVRPEKIVDEALAFLEAFPKEFSEVDTKTFNWQIPTVIKLVVENADRLGLRSKDRVRFHSTLTSTVLANLQDWALDDSLWTDFLEPTHGSTNADAERGGDADWYKLPGRRRYVGDYYNGRPIPLLPTQPDSFESSLVHTIRQEIVNRKYRTFGLLAWESAPGHSQRLFWLRQTLQSTPYYMTRIVDDARARVAKSFESIEIDVVQQEKWDELYPMLRSEVWDTPIMTSAERGSLRLQEVRQELMRYRRGVPIDSNIQSSLTGIHELWTEYELAFWARRFAASVVRESSLFDLSDAQLRAFLQPMLEYDDEGLKNIAEGWYRNLALRDKPLEFSAPTLDGDHFDIASLRGKVVLLDYWTTTCSACIAAMPRIHDVYLEYKKQGFEVVSINFDADRNRRKVERIEKELGLTWTTLNAEEQWQDVNERFGFGNILPVYMLLNREGKVVANTEDVDYGKNLRALLDELVVSERRP